MITKEEYEKAKITIKQYESEQLDLLRVSESNIEYCSCTNDCLGIYHKDRKCKKLRGYSR